MALASVVGVGIRVAGFAFLVVGVEFCMVGVAVLSCRSSVGGLEVLLAEIVGVAF